MIRVEPAAAPKHATRPRRSSARRSFDFGLSSESLNSRGAPLFCSLELGLLEDQKETERGLYRRNVVFARPTVALRTSAGRPPTPYRSQRGTPDLPRPATNVIMPK